MECSRCGDEMELILAFHNSQFYYESTYCTGCHSWCTEKIYGDGVAEVLWGRM